MATITGGRQVVVQDQSDSISFRLMVDDDPATLDDPISSHTLTIHSPGGDSELVSSTQLTSKDGAVGTYTRTWSSGVFARQYGYRAVWTLVSGGVTYIRESRFDVVRRLFESQLADSDITDLYPYIEDQLPSGVTSLKAWRQQAWRKIEEVIRRRWGFPVDRTRQSDTGTAYRNFYPGNMFYPEDFFQAHLELTVAAFHRANAFDTQSSEDWEKYKEAKGVGLQALDQALSNVAFDADDDGVVDNDEQGMFVNIEVIR